MTHVAVFGEMLVDRFASGSVVGGAPFNVARHLAAFGHAPLMLGAVGEDDAGTQVMAEVARYGMHAEGIQRTRSHPTGLVDVEMGPSGDHRFHIRTAGAWDFIEQAPALAAASALHPAGWLYAGTLALRSPTSRSTLLALMHAHRGPRYVDLNWRAGHLSPEIALQAVTGADLLKVNDEELAMLCGWLGLAAPSLDANEPALQPLVRSLDLRSLLVTRGAEGALAFDAQGRCTARHRDARPLRLVDTVGAGDAFSAVALVGLLRRWDMATLLARANAFAGHICELRGAVPARHEDYAEWTRDWSADREGVGSARTRAA